VTRRFLSGAAGVVLALGLAATTLAWANIAVSAECAPDEQTFAWTIQLPAGENNYELDWSFSADFSTFTTVDFGSAGEHPFTTLRSGTTLYVRWSSEHDTMAQAAANRELCASVTSTPTPEGSAKGGIGSPAASPEGNVQGGTGTPAAGVPDTAQPATGFPSSLPALVFGAILILSVSALALANIKVTSERR
jgi:hypothetical protein